jgi:hypothetical protein
MKARPTVDLYPQPVPGGFAVEPQGGDPSLIEPTASYLLAGLPGPAGMALERAGGDYAAACPLAVAGLGHGDVQPHQVGGAAAQPGQRRHRAAEPGRRGRQVHHDRRRRAEHQRALSSAGNPGHQDQAPAGHRQQYRARTP